MNLIRVAVLMLGAVSTTAIAQRKGGVDPGRLVGQRADTLRQDPSSLSAGNIREPGSK